MLYGKNKIRVTCQSHPTPILFSILIPQHILSGEKLNISMDSDLLNTLSSIGKYEAGQHLQNSHVMSKPSLYQGNLMTSKPSKHAKLYCKIILSVQ